MSASLSKERRPRPSVDRGLSAADMEASSFGRMNKNQLRRYRHDLADDEGAGGVAVMARSTVLVWRRSHLGPRDRFARCFLEGLAMTSHLLERPGPCRGVRRGRGQEHGGRRFAPPAVRHQEGG